MVYLLWKMKKRNNFIDAFLGFRIPLLLSFSRIPSPFFHFLFPPPSLSSYSSFFGIAADSFISRRGEKERGREEEDLSCPKNDTTIHALDSHTFAERKAWGMLQNPITNTILSSTVDSEYIYLHAIFTYGRQWFFAFCVYAKSMKETWKEDILTRNAGWTTECQNSAQEATGTSQFIPRKKINSQEGRNIFFKKRSLFLNVNVC